MQIRFLDLVESSIPGFPFMPGQFIDTPVVTPEMQAAIREGRAELVRGEEPERAVIAAPEIATSRRRGKRVSRA